MFYRFFSCQITAVLTVVLGWVLGPTNAKAYRAYLGSCISSDVFQSYQKLARFLSWAPASRSLPLLKKVNALVVGCRVRENVIVLECNSVRSRNSNVRVIQRITGMLLTHMQAFLYVPNEPELSI